MSFLEHLRTVWQRFEQRIKSSKHDVERDISDAVRVGLNEVADEVSKFALHLTTHAAEHPREIFAILRQLQPIVQVKGVAIVTRFADVEEVLDRDDVFDVPYEERMKLVTDGENFFLGMANTPRYARDLSNTRLLARREDVSAIIQPFVEKTANEIVASAPGSLDVVAQLTQIVPTRLVARYFGLTAPAERDLIAWTSSLFGFLFLDQSSDENVRAVALSSAKQLNESVDAAIQARKAEPGARDDIIGRALALQKSGTPGLRDLDIRNDCIGLIIGAIPTTATVTALALDELLRRPEALVGAQAAAHANDDALLGKYMYEALRFNPLAPAILRKANQDFVLARGEARERTIAAGTTVAVATLSAMFDSPRIVEPEAFRVDRADRDYLHFGDGLHRCFGYYINRVQIPLIVKPLLLRPNLRRAPGHAGELQRSAQFASSLTVLFD